MYKNPCVLDVETTGATNNTFGNPFCFDNKLVAVVLRTKSKAEVFQVEYGDNLFGKTLIEIADILFESDLIIGHNIKFDLNWIWQYGLGPSVVDKKLWDTGVYEYIVSRQKMISPSLNECLENRGFPLKTDIVKNDYWNQGIDTDKVPWKILSDYVKSDGNLTYSLFMAQQEEFKTLPINMRRLILLHMEDIFFFREVEHNGLMIDFDKCEKFARELDEQINDIDSNIHNLCGSSDINVDSPIHRSALLYGGSFEVDDKEDYVFTYKTGHTKVKTRRFKRSVKLPRLISPLNKSELARENLYSTDNKNLVKLSWRATGKAKKIIDMLLERAKISHLNKTYFKGFRKIYDEMGWDNKIVHGNMNQTITATGRPSSSKPNKQNMSKGFRECVISRFNYTGVKDDTL